MQGVILAAGRGSRLHPLTLDRSKAMIPILGRPIVDRVMESMAASGIRDFVLVVSDQDPEIQPYFERKPAPDLSIRFVIQPERRGMAHALQQAAPLIHGPFVLSSCDNLVPASHVADLIQIHQEQEALATLSLMVVPDTEIPHTGIVHWEEGRVTYIVEKPTLADAPSNIGSLPLYLFEPDLLPLLSEIEPSARGEYELQDAIQMLIQRTGRVTGVHTASRHHLTNAQDLLDINRYYLGQEPLHIAAQAVAEHTHLITPLRIEEEVVIGLGAVIGPRVYLEQGCQIGANALIKDAVVLRDAVVEDGAQIIGQVVS